MMSDVNTLVKKNALDCLLHPKSIAIIGASPNPGALGFSVLENLKKHDYQGEIYLVNPKYDTIEGHACLRSLDALPNGVDAAVLAIPRQNVLPTLEVLAEKKTKGAVIFSAGFAEDGPQGLIEQTKIAQLARQNDMVIDGPNCLGIISYEHRSPLTFIKAPLLTSTNARKIAIVSQSGAMSAVLSVSLTARALPLSYSISTGNEAVNGVEDFVNALIDNDNIDVFAMIVEQFRQPQEFLKASRLARSRGKSIVLLHPGKSAAARLSAATHTGAMAGDYHLMRVMVEREGVIIVNDLEELIDVSELLSRHGTLNNGRAVIVTESGAYKALALDLCDEVGLELAVLDGENHQELRGILPDFVALANPVDLTAQGLVDPSIYGKVINTLDKDNSINAVFLPIIQTDHQTCTIKFPPIIAALEQTKRHNPVIFAGLDEGAPVQSDYISALRKNGASYFSSPDRAIRALALLAKQASKKAFKAELVTKTIQFASNKTAIIAEYKAKALLADIGFKFPDSGFAKTLDEALFIAEKIGFPLVLKAQAEALAHKSDAGGVIINIQDRQQLHAAWKRLNENIAKARPDIIIDGVLVEKMAPRGLELIIGAKRDPLWGPVILVGAGGISAELYKDSCLIPAEHIDEQTIEDALQSLKCAAFLNGYRGSPQLDIKAIIDLILSLSAIMIGTPQIREIDLNPVIVYENGDGINIVDALIFMGKDA